MVGVMKAGGEPRGACVAVLMATVAAIAIVASTPALAQAAPVGQARGAELDFDIPAQPLADALIAFGKQAGLQVSAETGLTQNLRSPGVRGRMPAPQALSTLLSGTGLTYRLNGSMVALERAPRAAAGSNVIQLGPVRVEGASENPAATTPSSDPSQSEGTHSYAAQAATVAGKTPVPLREIPQSVSVMTRQQLDDQNLFTIEDAMRYVPGVTVATSGNPYLGASYYARGYSLASEYDGVPSSASLNTGNPQFDLAIYDRLEVLKGSAGLLQGSGEPGGVVNFVRKQPMDSFHVSGSASGGSWNDYHADADITGPLNASGTIRGRVVVAGQDQDFFYQGSHASSGTVYAIVAADLTPATEVSVSGTYQRDDRHGVFQGLPSNLDGSLLDVSRSFNPDPDWTRAGQTTAEVFGEITHKFGGDWKATGSLRYRDTTATARYAATNDPIDPTTSVTDYFSSIDLTGYSWFAADMNLTGSFELLGRTHQVLIGANYDKTTSRDQYGGSSFSNIDIFGPLFPDPHDVPTGDYRTTTEQYGAYGQVRLSLIDHLSAVLGGRVTHYTSTSGNGVYGEPVPMQANPGGVDARFTPYAGLIYDVTSQLSVYASYADIFVPQTSLTQGGSALPPRSGEEYEAGVKGAFLGGKLNVSGALFDLQDTHRAYNYPVGSFFYVDTGKVETKGFEFEISGSPLPGWDISAGYTYLDAKYDEDATQQGQAYNAAVTPHDNFKLWTTYRFSSGVLDRFSIGGGVLASSALVGNGVRAGGYAVFSGQVGYKLDEHWQASLTVNNIGDLRYYQTVNGPWSNNYYGEPRSAMFTIQMRY